MENAGQLLSLKVMRVSRPSLATAWEPFYSSSPSFSAHSTASLMSLQGNNPLPGHPKTLRDLTHITELLTLPAAFGAIQLGETFSSCLSINNDANVDVDGVFIRVEMQTASSKVTLAEFGGPTQRLSPTESIERVVSHEIKELGQHVLGCTVSYRTPPGVRLPPGQTGDEEGMQSFRKFYKFAVTNPLSVKTKVHTPRAPSAHMSSAEREKVFLEVHIQNLTQDAMWLERIKFECLEGWTSQDANVIQNTASGTTEYIFSGSTALMQPQDLRQYIYILSPVTQPAFPVAHAPGSIVGLGRLDISWRSSYGEPGRLLTSTLSRRIPLIQAPQPPSNAQTPTNPSFKQTASALPLHLQRSHTISGGTPPRPHSPQFPHSARPTSPPVNPTSPAPYRPNSPFRSARNSTMGPPSAPALSPNPVGPAFQQTSRTPEGVEVDLIVTDIPRDALVVDRPFDITFKVTVQAPVVLPLPEERRKQRVISLVVQHLQTPAPPEGESTLASNLSAALAAAPRNGPAIVTHQGGTWSPQVPSSGFSTPSPYDTPMRSNFPDTLSQQLLTASPRRVHPDADSDADTDADGADTPNPLAPRVIDIPPPVSSLGPGESASSHGVAFLGPSALFLPPFKLAPPAPPAPGEITGLGGGTGRGHMRGDSTDTEGTADDDRPLVGTAKVAVSHEFALSYVSQRSGFLRVGGLRVILLGDKVMEEDESSGTAGVAGASEVRTLREWDVVAEIWVKS